MTANDPFDRMLRGFLETAAPVTAPAGLHDDVIDRARRSRQRPGWLVGVRGGAFGMAGTAAGLPGSRVAYLLVVMVLLLAALIVAIAAGAFRPNPINQLLGRNGAIVYDLQDVTPGIHLVGADGGEHHEIAGGSCPTYSRDGSVLASWVGASPELVVAAADGSSPRRLSVFAGGGHPEDRFALSPDGTQVAWIKRLHRYERSLPDGSTIDGWDDELWVIPVSGGPGVRIVPISGARNEVRALPAWSPDGRRIAYSTFVSLANESYRSSIDLIDVGGSNPVRLTTRPGTGLGGMSWSPDSRFIAYAGLPDASIAPSPDQELDIFVIDVEETADRNLTNTAANEAGPQWSPDGSHLGYLTFDEAIGERLDTIRMDGPNAIGSAAIGPIISRFFTWSPDGTRLLLLQTTSTGSTDRLRGTRSTISSVDPEFKRSPAILVEADYIVLCPPSWQRLEP